MKFNKFIDFLLVATSKQDFSVIIILFRLRSVFVFLELSLLGIDREASIAFNLLSFGEFDT